MREVPFRRIIVLAVSLLALGPLHADEDARGGASDPVAAFAAHPMWDDGRAEVSRFDAEEVRYGTPRPASVTQILVKEDLLPGTLVKADDWRRPGLIPAFKFNWVLDIPTGIYRYNQMLTVLLERSDLSTAKMTLTSHEWCGNTWKMLVTDGTAPRLEYRTYWQGEAEGQIALQWPEGTIPEDALHVRLRALDLARPGEQAVSLAPSLVGNRVGPVKPFPATIRVIPGRAVPGSTWKGSRVTVTTELGEDRWWIEEAFPHRILRWQRKDGAIYHLRASKRLAYWQLTAPEDTGVLDTEPRFEPPIASQESER